MPLETAELHAVKENAMGFTVDGAKLNLIKAANDELAAAGKQDVEVY